MDNQDLLMATASEGTVENSLSAIRYAAGTDVGMRREENQDSYGIIEASEYRFYIVADGMGGVKGGAIASNLAITTVEKAFHGIRVAGKDEILDALHEANETIHIKGKEDPGLNGMGTTFVGLFFAGTSLHVVNVGDSRAYRIRGNDIKQLTEDHTLVRELMRQGAISEAQAEHHPVAHMLTRSLGPTPEILIDCEVLRDGPIRGDKYLLCSDGLYNLVKDSEIAEIVRDNSSDNAIQKLIDLANERGGTDNITVLVVEVESDYPVGIEDIQVIADEEPKLQAEIAVAEGAEAVEPEYVNGHNKPAEKPKRKSKKAQPEQIQEDQEAEEETIVEVEREQSRSPLRSAVLTVVAFIGGIAVTYSILGSHQSIPASTTTTVKEPVAIAAKAPQEEHSIDTTSEAANSVAALTQDYSEGAQSGVAAGLSMTSSHVGDSERLGPSERAAISRRKKELTELIEKIDGKLARFDQPISGDEGNVLADSSKRTEELNAKLEGVRGDVDAATRKLAVWYGRKKRLDSSDPIKLASEVAVSSEAVKQKKEAFERATWEYIKQVEALRYTPGDRELVQKAEELRKLRSDKMTELRVAVKTAIDESVSESDHGIAELTMERDRITVELDSVKGDVEFVKTLMGSNDEAKAQLKAELQRRRENAASELDELTNLVPE